MKHGLIKVAAVTPRVHLGDCAANARACARLAVEAAEAGVKVAVFPELSLTGATAWDLLATTPLLRGAIGALLAFAEDTAELDILSVIGLPVAFADRVYNCAAVVAGGSVLGLVPKRHLDAAERRVFAPAPEKNLTYDLTPELGYIPLGVEQLFVSSTLPALRIGVAFGSELVAAGGAAARLASGGATVIACPAVLPELVGAGDRCRLAVRAEAARLVAGCIFSAAGEGESTTDHAYAGRAIIAEGDTILAEHPAFLGEGVTATELDLERLLHDRRIGGFDNAAAGELAEAYFNHALEETALTRPLSAHPFLPADPALRGARCEEVLAIQAAGLKSRISPPWVKKIILGISGGLDSTLAILVMARAMDALGRPRRDIIAVTMPCFGTTVRTRTNATVLCEELGVDFRCVDILAAVNQHFADIGHDPENHNVVYENAQARERTQVLMDIANAEGGMVIGTGDLSELALGWATYNGDHMSMYGVNGGVPKTLIRHIVGHVAATERAAGRNRLADALEDILGTPVSPELLPADASGKIAQITEDLVGPYELHDFYLYYTRRYGFGPEKLFRLCRYAFGSTYDDRTLLHWLETFARRFFNQQFKRSCLPDGPAVGAVGLSPRGGWRMPSDASSALWMAEIAALKELCL